MASPETAAKEAITIVSVLALLFFASIFTFVIGGRRKNNQLDVPDNDSSQTRDGSPDDRRKSRDSKQDDGKKRKKHKEGRRGKDEGGTNDDGGSRVRGEEGSDDGDGHGGRRDGGSSATSPDSPDLSSAYTVRGGDNDNPPPGHSGTRAGTMTDVFRIADDLKLTVQSNPDDRYRVRTIYNGDPNDSTPRGGGWPRSSDGPGGGAEGEQRLSGFRNPVKIRHLLPRWVLLLHSPLASFLPLTYPLLPLVPSSKLCALPILL